MLFKRAFAESGEYELGKIQIAFQGCQVSWELKKS